MADVLLLNANAQPINYLPLSTVDWKDAILYMYHQKCSVLEWYDDWLVRSPSWETKVPAVIMLKDYVKQKTQVRFSKFNVFLRDEYTCLYCDKDVNRNSATLDHVIPLSKGGKTDWLNIVTSCGHCNSTKGNNTNMKPKYKPYRPDYWELVQKRKMLPFTVKHPSWENWLKY
jgi:5-methylcytosine-specific restriction endonuclease McrA